MRRRYTYTPEFSVVGYHHQRRGGGRLKPTHNSKVAASKTTLYSKTTTKEWINQPIINFNQPIKLLKTNQSYLEV